MAKRITFELVKSTTDATSRAYNLKSDKTKWEGTMFFGPTPGQSFSFFRDDQEYMHTSTVQNVQYIDDNTLVLTTRNSEYKLSIGEEVEPK